MMGIRILLVVCLLLAVCALTGCAAQGNPYEKVPNEQDYTAGFWRGLWHGIIAPITFIISLFSDTVNMYEVHNNGNWYNLGFILGLSISMGGGGLGAGRRHR